MGRWRLVVAVLVILFTIIPSVQSEDLPPKYYICLDCVPPANSVSESTPINQPPILDHIGDQPVAEGSVLTFPVTATDPDGDFLTFTAVIPPGAEFIPSGANYTFSWTPNYSQAGIYAVNFTVVDTGGLMDSEGITITVLDVNLPPVLDFIGNKTVAWNSTLTFTITATDPDGDSLTYSTSSLPLGAIFDNGRGVFSWTPTYSDNGTYYVNFAVMDGGGLIDNEDVRIRVTEVDHPPDLATIGNKTVDEHSTLTFPVTATDPDLDGITYNAAPLPQGASFDKMTHVFSWTPSYSQSGSYSINFTVNDGSLMDYETILITVLDVNVPPILNFIGNRTVNEGLLLTFAVNATDADNDTLTFNTSSLPQRATFNASSMTFSWIPSYSQAGTYSVNFTVTDAGGLMDFENVTIEVFEPVKIPGSSDHYAPVFNPVGTPTALGTDTIIGAETYLMTFQLTAIDFDSDTLMYSAVLVPPGAYLDPTSGVFSWTPEYGGSGSYFASFAVNDGFMADTLSVTLIVTSPPTPTDDCG